MMVPRSYRYGAASTPATTEFDSQEKSKNVFFKPSAVPRTLPDVPVSLAPVMPKRATAVKRNAVPASVPTRPVEIPDRTRPPAAKSNPHDRRRSTANPQCSDSIRPSVAALLAMTTIPPHRPGSTRRRRTTGTPSLSIDELVDQWKNDDTLRSSLASSPSMSVLLEEASSMPEPPPRRREKSDSMVPSFVRTRSVSSDSIPSLEEDERSLLSLHNPSTPGSLSSRSSATYLRRFKSASLSEDCLRDHPLLVASPALNADAEIELPFEPARTATTKPRSSFRSNLTTSLQALKNAALSSISSLTPVSQANRRASLDTAPDRIDGALWSHPFLFPRLSSEMRPTIQGTPTMAQRRYLNPMPLTFEEQEAPFQRALHAPFLTEAVNDAPTIQLQTYTKSRRLRNKSRSSSPDPQSEAGRAQVMTSGIRQREPRENADFLRVVVLEMNMRRAGKLETGRARIWLPPRQVSNRNDDGRGRTGSNRVPVRWRGICAPT